MKVLLAVVVLLWISVALVIADSSRRGGLPQPSLPVAGSYATSATAVVPPSQPMDPRKSENGDVRGKDNDGDGEPETVYVEGYTRKDGVKVKGHYRAK
jgi:hypothetical protein